MLKNTPHFDILIGGAGIIGLSTAWQLLQKQPSLRIAVLEKESAPAMHQSSRNSGVIHSGIYYEPGSAKAENCLKGYRMLLDFAGEYKVPHRICGKIIAAVEVDEIPTLSDILHRGKDNHLDGIEVLDEKASREAEPHVQAMESIWVPQAGIIDYGGVSNVLAKQLQDLDASLYFDHAIIDLHQEPHHMVVSSQYGDFKTNLFINCCGLYADRIALLTGMRGKFRILPFRGEFYRLSGATAGMVNHLVYPVPDERFPFLGVHFTLRMDGNVEAGPNAMMAFAREGYRLYDINAGELSEILTYTGFYRMAIRYWKKGWEEMHRSLSKRAFHKSMQRLIPATRIEDMHYNRSGVRAQCVSSQGKMIYDYLILEEERVINLVNAPSPAATSALAIGEFIAEKAIGRLNRA
ncbi:MAG TPA: L-2-hydroxyglutarate oxidase [Saprospiraceae bacterium]|nr:L-2-hydroxyglutarate oxidase [Saprospiraceae bacterium]